MKVDVSIRLLLVGLALGGCKTTSGVSDVAAVDNPGSSLCNGTNDTLTLHLDKCAGQFTFLQVMTSSGGIKAMIDADGVRKLKIADSSSISQTESIFAPDVKSKLLKLFRNGQSGFDGLVSSLQGGESSPLQMAATIRGKLQDGDVNKPVPLAAVMIAPYLSITSGGGSQVYLDDVNHYINIGYGPGSDAHDVKTGRSFGVSRGRGALDPSDPYFLDELGSYLQQGDRQAFYKTLFRILTAADPSGVASLSTDGQTLMTDFIAIYTAELDRHVMTNFQQHPWENDLAEATWVSAYVVTSGKMMKNGALTSGRTRDFFAQGASGGGIGETRNDRRGLQSAISKFEWSQQNNDAINNLAQLIGVSQGGDVIQGLATYLTTPANAANVLQNAQKITDAATAFMVQIGNDANAITLGLGG